MTLLDAWELAAREFEPARQLWTHGSWKATVEAEDRLRIDGPTSALAYTLPAVDLRWLRPDAVILPPEDTLPAADREATYHPYGSAREILRTGRSEVLAAGPAGTGKSLACLWRVHLMAMLYPGLRALIVRKTAVSLTSTGLVTFREHVIPAARAAGLVHWYGGSKEQAAAYQYKNGSEVVVGGLDKPDKIMSSEYDVVFVQEATETTITDWEAIITRLRHSVSHLQQVIADCNPAHPRHWLKERCDAGTVQHIHCRHEDNPTLFDPVTGEMTPAGKTYIQEKLDKLTGVRYQRYRLGRWCAAEGVIYEDWDEAIHLVDRPDPIDPDGSPSTCLPVEWTRWWSMDFGFTNPFVAQCWAEDPDGRLWLEWEVYHTGRLVEEHAVTILDQVTEPIDGYTHPRGERQRAHHGRRWTGPKPRAVICDHDAEGRATLAKELGMSTKAATKKVIEGIQAVQARYKLAGDGRPRIILLRDAVVERDQALKDAGRPTCTAEEIPGYVWDASPGKAPKETPLKNDDHGMDAKRYIVAEKDLGGRPNIRIM